MWVETGAGEHITNYTLWVATRKVNWQHFNPVLFFIGVCLGSYI